MQAQLAHCCPPHKPLRVLTTPTTVALCRRPPALPAAMPPTSLAPRPARWGSGRVFTACAPDSAEQLKSLSCCDCTAPQSWKRLQPWPLEALSEDAQTPPLHCLPRAGPHRRWRPRHGGPCGHHALPRRPAADCWAGRIHRQPDRRRCAGCVLCTPSRCRVITKCVHALQQTGLPCLLPVSRPSLAHPLATPSSPAQQARVCRSLPASKACTSPTPAASSTAVSCSVPFAMAAAQYCAVLPASMAALCARLLPSRAASHAARAPPPPFQPKRSHSRQRALILQSQPHSVACLLLSIPAEELFPHARSHAREDFEVEEGYAGEEQVGWLGGWLGG